MSVILNPLRWGCVSRNGFVCVGQVNLKCVGGQDADELSQLSEIEARFDEVSGQCENLCTVAEKQRQQLESPERSIEEYSGLSLTNLEVRVDAGGAKRFYGGSGTPVSRVGVVSVLHGAVFICVLHEMCVLRGLSC